MYKVVNPWHNKYHPEDVFFPGDFVIVEDKQRAESLIKAGLIKEFNVKVLRPEEKATTGADRQELTPDDGKEQEQGSNTAAEALQELTIKELKAMLDQKGIKYADKALKGDLIELLSKAD